MGHKVPRRFVALTLAGALSLVSVAIPPKIDAATICYWSGYKYSTTTGTGDIATSLKTTIKFQTAHECSGNPIYVKVNQITATYKATDKTNTPKLHIIKTMRLVQAPGYYGTWDDVDNEGSCWDICTVTEIEYPNYTLTYHTKNSVYFFCQDCRVIVGGFYGYHHFITNKRCSTVDCSS